MSGRALLALFLLVPAFAGCTQTPKAPLDATDPGTAGGSGLPLRGWVFDSAVEPVPGANVSVYGTNQSTVTDADGAYGFASIPRATPLVITAAAAGFISSSSSITVPEQDPAVLNFTLAAIPLKEPRTAVIELPGFLSCQAFVTASGEESQQDCGSSDSNNVPSRDFTMQADVAGIVLELVWDPGTPAAETLQMIVESVGFGDQDAVLATAVGPSVLKAQVNEQAARKYYSTGGIARVTVSTGAEPDAEENSVGASVAAQQHFTVYASVFYVNPPAPTYTALE